ncbi:MAG TPA: twin-arginine translocase subunit TatC [Mycobacteriales bacterium]|nr:twin-arginine translocase subunit TatC [Mycobacteriales bacterium]
MPLVEHLRELRSRLLKALLALVLATAVAFVFFDPVFDVLKRPYCRLPVAHQLGDRCTLVVTGILDAFFLRLKVSLIVGTILSSPVWLYQLWSFVTPGLHRHERRWSLTFLATAVPLFLAGSAVAYLTLDRGLALLLGFTPEGVTNLIRVNDYLSYVTLMLLVFGASFELPLLIVLLNLAGVVSAARLRASWRGVVFGIVVFAAVATPSQDPFTMLALATPMTALFGAALLVAAANDRRRARRGAASPYAALGDDETSPLDPAPSPLDERADATGFTG